MNVKPMVGGAGALLCGALVVGAQTDTAAWHHDGRQGPATHGPDVVTGRASGRGEVTVVGCLERDGSQGYLLTNAELRREGGQAVSAGARGSGASAEHEARGQGGQSATGSDAAPAFRLSGIESDRLQRFVGQRVEVRGRVSGFDAGGATGAAPGHAASHPATAGAGSSSSAAGGTAGMTAAGAGSGSASGAAGMGEGSPGLPAPGAPRSVSPAAGDHPGARRLQARAIRAISGPSCSASSRR